MAAEGEEPAKKPKKPVGAARTRKANRAPTAIKTAERHREVVNLRLDGRDWPYIIEKTGLALRTCREVWQTWCELDKADLVQEDPLEVALEHIAGFKRLRTLAADVYAESAGQVIQADDGSTVVIGANSNARLGALKLMAELRAKDIDLRQETGLLPRNLGQLQIAVDVRWWTEQIIEVFREFEVPVEAQDRLLELLQRDDERERRPALTAGE